MGAAWVICDLWFWFDWVCVKCFQTLYYGIFFYSSYRRPVLVWLIWWKIGCDCTSASLSMYHHIIFISKVIYHEASAPPKEDIPIIIMDAPWVPCRNPAISRSSWIYGRKNAHIINNQLIATSTSTSLPSCMLRWDWSIDPHQLPVVGTGYSIPDIDRSTRSY